MLQALIDWILHGLLGISKSGVGEMLNFFIYDTIKILLLVFIMISVVGFLRSYLSPEKVKMWLTKRGEGVGNLFASLFGAITPFCSCSSIPLFLGFVEAGIPLGIAFSFLITAPLVNEYLVVLMLGYFGWKITVLYVLGGVLIGVISGLIMGRLGLEKYLVRDMKGKSCKLQIFKTITDRVRFGVDEAVTIVKRLWLWILVAVGLGAVIHNYVPKELVLDIVGAGGLFTVPIATFLGVPMYGSCVAIVPIAVVLFEKGLPLGTALAFMMATAALSLPEAIILRRAMKLKLIAIFFGIVTLGIIVIGYVFNFLQNVLI